MNKRMISLLVYITIAFLYSCQPSIEYIEVVEIQEVIRDVEVIEYVDNIVYNESIVYYEKEIYIMSEEEIIVDPIQEYDNYITCDSKVMGVTADGFEEIPLITDLFKIDNVIYFTEGDYLCSQENGVVTIIEPADFPEADRSECITFSSGDYAVKKEIYNDEVISKVFNGTLNVGYYMIDGSCMRGDDLIYSCPIDTGTRLKGVYIWTVKGNPLLLFENGRIW